MNARGHIKYDADIHFNKNKRMTEEDLEYLCKFHKLDGITNLSYSLGRTPNSLSTKICELKRNGKYEYYRNLNNYI